jgi:hypothetical protein
MKRKTFEELLEAKVQISLINEPPQVEMRRLTAREIARRRWGMEDVRREEIEACA